MPIRVILADDHAVVLDGLRVLLESQGDISVVGTASDGRTAVALARELLPDIVVMDISMPELNGIDATCELREALPNVRVIILSMHSTSEHIYRALQAGARGYVIKESAGKEVVKAVIAVHGGKRYISEKISDLIIDDYVLRKDDSLSPSPLARLSLREREVLQLVVEGRSSSEIAGTLFLSPKSVDTYRSRLMQKLGVKDLSSLIKFAIQHGLTSLE
ncbi:MAG: response regulator transcription factor [Ignavibacteria bacterium]|nr:response regulator transcription factor [Ignavibacteria bacterium]